MRANQPNQLKVSNISCERQENIIFQNLNFMANSGDLVRILGKNGSGKSSLLKIITGLLKPVTGNIQWNQQAINLQRAEFVKQLTYIGHKAAIKTELSVTENISTLLSYSGLEPQRQSIDNALAQLELSRYSNVQAGYLSQGQQRRIALSRLWLEHTFLWILDEPYTALDSQAIELVNGVIEQALSRGTIVIYTSHLETEYFADRVTNVSLGRGPGPK